MNRPATKAPPLVPTLFAAAILASALVAGCSYPTASSPYPGGCTTLEPVVWSPAGFSTNAPTDVVIRVQFDDYPDPATVRSDSLLITTGFFWVPGDYGVDLAAKTAILRPWAPLSPDLGYTLHLMPALASLTGCSAPYTTREFRTGSGPANLPAPPVPAFSDVQAIFDRRCAGAGCHLDGDRADGTDGGAPDGSSSASAGSRCATQPAAALSLCDAEAWNAIVNIPSHQDQTLMRVRPGASASSYLFRKLLLATNGGGPPPPTLGHRDPPGAPLDDADIATIAAWIDAGASR